MIKKILALVFAFLATATFAAVDVNKADQAQLESVKGIGPSIATKILDERKNGSFKDWADLVERVKGVGVGNASKFSAEGLTVNGAAFNASSATAPQPQHATKSKKSHASDTDHVDSSTAATADAASTPASKKKPKKDKKAASGPQ